jgi:hypothetical protein
MASTKDEWVRLAKRHLKAELKRAGIGYAELARLLTATGLPETEASIAMKISRGTFPAWFLFAALKTIGGPAG